MTEPNHSQQITPKSGLKQSQPPLIIIGAGGHALNATDVAWSTGFTIKHFVDKNKKGSSLFGIKIIEDVAVLDAIKNYCFFIAVGDNAVRARIYNELKAKYPTMSFATLIHPSAVIANGTKIGVGTIVMPNSAVHMASIVGKFCLLDSLTLLGHGSAMNDFSSLAPGVIICGAVKVGLRSAICAGTVVDGKVTIGDDTVVGAQSYVNRDLPSNQVAYGVPAKMISQRSAGDPYLK